MGQVVDLINFFVFDHEQNCREGEEYQKVLYYYPDTHDVNTQVNNVGLVEALIKFTGNFKPSSHVNSLHTQKKRQLYLQTDADIWMVMTLSIPTQTGKKENEERTENCCYLEETVQDNVYEAVLKQAYLMYKLFFGPIVRNAPNLKANLNSFYSTYMPTLKLSQNDTLHSFEGISFLPLNKENFIKISCFVNVLQNHFASIAFVSLLYNNSVIWGSVEPRDLQVMHKYLRNKLLDQLLQVEMANVPAAKRTLPIIGNKANVGRFIVGPQFLHCTEPTQLVHINNETYSMVVYRILNLTLCVFFDAHVNVHDQQLFKRMEELIGPKLLVIGADVADYCAKSATVLQAAAAVPNLLYFNELNLACKSVVLMNERETIDVEHARQAIRIMANMNGKKERMGKVGETIVKTVNDCWVVGRVSDLREFYVSIQQKKESLIYISEEVKKLCDVQFKGIFIYPL